MVFGARLALAEAIAGYDRTQVMFIAWCTLLGLAVVTSTQNTDTFFASGILELAADRIAHIALDARAQITLHTLVAIPVELIFALALLGIGACAGNSFTYIALGWLQCFLMYLLFQHSYR